MAATIPQERLCEDPRAETLRKSDAEPKGFD